MYNILCIEHVYIYIYPVHTVLVYLCVRARVGTCVYKSNQTCVYTSAVPLIRPQPCIPIKGCVGFEVLIRSRFAGSGQKFCLRLSLGCPAVGLKVRFALLAQLRVWGLLKGLALGLGLLFGLAFRAWFRFLRLPEGSRDVGLFSRFGL